MLQPFVRDKIIYQQRRISVAKKVEIAIEVNPDNVEMMDKIVADYRIKDRSKAFSVLLDYVVDNEKAWDEMFKRKSCKRCY